MTENNKVTVTLKAHGGYDAPWIVFNDDTVQGVLDQMQAAEVLGLYVQAGNAAESFTKHAHVGGALGAVPASPGVPPQAAAPAAATAVSGPPGSTAPSCPHGAKVYKTSKPGAARAWKAWMCPTPQGTPGQCPPEWIN